MGGAALALASCQQRSPSTEVPEPKEVETKAHAVALAGFDDVAIMTGLVQPTVVKFAPNGKVFVGQKDGRIYVYDNADDTTATLFADLRTQVMNYWDRGLLGLAIDPNYPSTPNVYVAYTWDVDSMSGTAPRWNDGCADPTGAGCVVYARVARLTDMGNSGSTTSSLTPILSGWGQQFPSHSIGSLEFGPDGGLYVAAGEGANFNAEDWGQWAGNPLADPPGGAMTPPSARGGALRSQSLRRPSGEPVLLSGAILRLDKNTGAHMADN
ncbi:MAG TPA: PQQ-dependent sugar dehydrogenase, partial [Polyangia bacterium]